ncbi:MAG TPA: HAMP domain-containing sensor histidine kinase [Cyclobacteriaceae bacterium]|jgi:signal transduction histidine kinase|nr:HAMP domain-containing sensor histidine kinase [Cyclobacteriaceae bacterium]
MDFNIRLNLSKRITLGYVIIITVALVTTGYSIYTLQCNKQIDQQIQNTLLPFYLKLKDLNALNREASKLTNHWIYQPSIPEKKQLINLQNHDYPVLKEGVIELSRYSSIPVIRDSVEEVLESFDHLIVRQKVIMSTLNRDSMYSDDLAVDTAIAIWSKDIVPAVTALDKQLYRMLTRQRSQLDNLQEKKERADTFLSGLLLCMIIIFVIAFVVTYIYARKSIVDPIVKAKNLIVSLGQGKLIKIQMNDRKDEIGEMMFAMSRLTEGMNSKSEFADRIGKGNFGEHFDLQGPDDVMGRALLNMRDQLKKKNAELDRLVYSASHDLRSPIASVKGLINLVKMDTSTPNIERCLLLIGRSMDRLDITIQEILDFFQNARSEIKEDCFNIVDLVNVVINDHALEPGFSDGKFLIHMDQNDNGLIQTDINRLKLILSNLVSNAIQFRNKNVPVEIVIDIRISNCLEISVQDNGIGIDPNNQHRIFDMFFRGDAERSGSGLGLYIVREVVSTLGGTIAVRSKFGEGSTFTVQVPVKIASLVEEVN